MSGSSTQQQQATHDLLISNQVSKDFEQLASDKITERLGGIYALEGVMNTSDQYHQPVLEALCAFVRESTTREKGPLTVLLEAFSAAPRGTAEKANDKPPNDIQAALTVIGRRKPGDGDVNLTRAIIPGANLIRANLGDAHLSGANLSGAYLGDADLHFASLSGANPSDAGLRVADLSGANLSDADLIGAHLSGADLRFANLGDADLISADLSGADLSGARGLTQAQLDQACGKPKALPPGLTLDKPCPPRPGAQ
jgi:hypothetical protein